MKMYREMSLNNFEAWGGAIDTLNRVKEEGKVELLEQVFEELYPDGMSETEINDILAFDDDWVFDTLGIDNYDEEFNSDDFADMYACDFSGFCSGASCPRFFECKG